MITPEAFLFGFTQGFVIGPLSLYAIREGLNPKKGFWYQLQVICASALVDAIYLLVATYGVVTFIEYSGVKFFMWTVAAYMLVRMGMNNIHEKHDRMSFYHTHRHRLSFFETDFFRGLVISLFNPMAIVFSFMVVGSLYSTYSGQAGPALFALNVNLGGFLAGLIVCMITFLVRKAFHPWMLKKCMTLGSFILVGYGTYFAYRAALEAGPIVQKTLVSVLGLF